MKKYEFKFWHYLLLLVFLLVIMFTKNHIEYKREVNRVLSEITVENIDSLEVTPQLSFDQKKLETIEIDDKAEIEQFVSLLHEMKWKKTSGSVSWSTDYKNYNFVLRGDFEFISIHLVQNKHITLTYYTEEKGFQHCYLKVKWPSDMGHNIFEFLEE